LLNRKMQWNAPEPKVKKGYLYQYSKMASSANEGGIFKGYND